MSPPPPRPSITRPAGLSDADWDRASKALAATRVRMPGNSANPGGGESGNATRRSLTVIYTTGAFGDLEIEIPVQFKTLSIPYHFENLPLPRILPSSKPK
jgi:hypothetical protein